MKSILSVAIVFMLSVNTYGQKLATLVVNETPVQNNSSSSYTDNKNGIKKQRTSTYLSHCSK